jgi:hypothetical protein
VFDAVNQRVRSFAIAWGPKALCREVPVDPFTTSGIEAPTPAFSGLSLLGDVLF